MDFENYVINYVLRIIPREVVDLATTDRKLMLNRHIPLETKLLTTILKPSFFLDLSLITGLEIVIPIHDLPLNSEQDGVTLLKIPDSILQGRQIINALSLTNSSETKGITAQSSHEGFKEVMNNNNSWGTGGITARLEAISPNEILVYENIANISELALRVTVQLSDNYNEINTKSYPQLANIALDAAMMMIHTKLIIKQGQASLYHGHELSVIDNVISDYSGAHVDYYEKLPLMKKTIFMNDEVSMARYVRNMIPNHF